MPDTRTRASVIDPIVAGTVVPMAVITVVLYAVAVVALLLARPLTPMLGLLLCLHAVTILGALLLPCWWHRHGRAEWSHRVINALGLIAIVNAVAYFAMLEPRAAVTTNFMALALALALALLVVDLRSFLALQLLAASGWTAVVLLTPVADIYVWVWRYLFAVFLATMVYASRWHVLNWLARRELLLAERNGRIRALLQAPEFIDFDLTGLLRRVCATAGGTLAVSRVGVWDVGGNDENGEHIRCLALFDDHGEADEGMVLQRAAVRGYFDAVLGGDVFQADDIVQVPVLAQLRSRYLDDRGIRAMLDVPIIIEGRVVGVICHEHRGGIRSWSIEDRTFATSLADVAALAISADRRVRLERRQREMERAESLGLLAGGVAHDFNNLLTVVLGEVEVLEGNAPSATDAESLASIRAAGERARDLAMQMLAYAGRASLTRRRVDPAALLRELDERWGRELAGAARLEIELPKASLPGVDIDVTQVRQVLMNLVVNAREAGAGRIVLRAGTVTLTAPLGPEYVVSEGVRPGDHVWIEVEDDGCGMDARTRHRVFEPFFTTRQEGTGLGLAAVLGVLRAHGGTVRVDSIPGAGTRMRLLLPALDAPVASARRVADGETTLPAGLRLLLVEDEALVRQFVEALLHRFDCAVDAFAGCADVRSALATLALDDVDVALVDMSLQDGDGLSVLRALRQRRPGLPVVLMSGYDSGDVMARLGPEERAGFLQKPFRLADLAAVLDAALHDPAESN